jgi:hypothetical protein
VSYTRQFNPDRVMLEQDPICAWLIANDVEPNYVPLDARIAFDRRNMTVEQYARHDDGSLVLDLDRDVVVRTTVTVPIRRRPPVLASLGPARRKR